MRAKTVGFTLMMGALGNALFVITYYVGQIAPGVALDFSLLPAYIAGFYGGPLIGFISGLLVGVLPGIMFGPMGMCGWLGLIVLPIGKSLTGLTVGAISESVGLRQNKRSSLFAIPVSLMAYVPEGVFTYAVFEWLLPFFIGSGGALIFLYYILPKALAEIVIISFFMVTLLGNKGFNEFLWAFMGLENRKTA
ncbi:MAG: hypothetical protein QXS79_05045 [Candidatus Bathyarchaeia archaeon]